MHSPGLDDLSPQEQRVLKLVVQGMTNKQIAQVLGLSDKTVKNYLSNAFQKLQVRRRAGAACLFEELRRCGDVPARDADYEEDEFPARAA